MRNLITAQVQDQHNQLTTINNQFDVFSSNKIKAVKKMIEAIDDGLFSGKAYSRLSDLYQQIVKPLDTSASNLVEDMHYQLNKLNSNLSQLTTDSYDEERLIKRIADLQALIIRIESYEFISVQGAKHISMARAEIDQNNRYLAELDTFDTATKDLFVDLNDQIDVIIQGLDYLEQGRFDHNGFTAKAGANLLWLDQINQYNAKYAKSKKTKQIQLLEDTYGLTNSQAKQLFEFNQQFDKYAKEQKWNTKEASYQYARTIASMIPGYQKIEWQSLAGTLSQAELSKRLKAMGVNSSVSDKNGIIYSINTNHKSGPKDPTPTNDFAHIMASLSIMNNPNQVIGKAATSGKTTAGLVTGVGGGITGGLLAQFESQDNLNAFATFRGDIASGSLDNVDVKADLDALILNNQIQNSDNQSIVQVINDYAGSDIDYKQEITNIYGSQDNFKAQVTALITDPAGLALEGTNQNVNTTDDAKKFWDLYEKMQ